MHNKSHIIILFLIVTIASLTLFHSSVFAQKTQAILIDRYQNALAVDTANPILQYQLGVALLIEGRNEAAIERFQLAYPAYTDSIEMNYNLGLAFSKTGDTDSAVLYFEQAEALGAFKYPQRYPLEDAYFNLGLTYLNQDLLDEAEQILNKVLAINPGRYQVHHALGKLYTLRQQPNKAIDEYEQYLAAAPQDQAVRDFVFASHYNEGLKQIPLDPAAARVALNTALEIEPNHPHALYALAHLDMQDGQLITAIDSLNQLYPQADQSLKENIRVVLYNSALALQQRNWKNDLERADMAIKRVLEDAPEDINALFLAGNIALARKQHDDARQFYESLLHIDPTHQGALLNLTIARKGAVKELVADGRALLLDQRYIEALASFESALTIDPTVPDAAQLAKQTQKKLAETAASYFSRAEQALESKDLNQALELARKGLTHQPDDPRGVQVEKEAVGQLTAELDARLSRARAFFDEGDLEQAEENYNSALLIAPDNSTALAGLAAITQRYQDSAAHHLALAQQALDTDNLLSAEDHYRSARELQPDNKAARDGLESTLSRIDTTVDRTIKQAENAVHSGDFRNARVSLEKAFKLRQTDDIRERITALEQQQETHIQNLLNQAARAIRNQEFKAAEATYTTLKAFAPAHAGLRLGLVQLDVERQRAIEHHLTEARHALEAKDSSTALVAYRTVLDLSPSNQAALDGLKAGKQLAEKRLSGLMAKANSAIAAELFSDAENTLKKILKLDPYHTEATAALNRLRNTRQKGLKPGDDKRLYLEGIQYYTKGQYEAAIGSWEQVLLLVPDHEKASMNIDKSRRKLRMIKERKQE